MIIYLTYGVKINPDFISEIVDGFEIRMQGSKPEFISNAEFLALMNRPMVVPAQLVIMSTGNKYSVASDTDPYNVLQDWIQTNML